MTDLDLKNSRKIIKVKGIPIRPVTASLSHQANMPDLITRDNTGHTFTVT